MDEENILSNHSPPEKDNPVGDLISLCSEINKEIQEVVELISNGTDHKKHYEPPEWMTAYEVRIYFSISKLTLKRYREQHKISYMSICGRYRYKYEDLKLFVKCKKY